MRNAPRLYVLLCLALSLGLAGCDKPTEEKPPLARSTPTPTAADPATGDGKDFSARNIRHKADQAASRFEKFLKDQDPKMREKVQHLADKVSDKIGADKNHWREKLEEKRRELQPQIAQLEQQLGQTDGDKNKQKLKDALSKLEDRSQDTDKKLAELESAGMDAWQQFKSQLKEDEARDDTPPTDDATPTPSPHRR